MKKFLTFKYAVFNLRGDSTASFLFLNSGKDLALVSDTTDWGNVAVTDRRVLLDLMQTIDSMKDKPKYTVMDIEFYYPFTADPKTDTLLGGLLAKTPNLLIPVLSDGNDGYLKPLYPLQTGYADYRTFGPNYSKFRILDPGKEKSIPVIMDEQINGRKYEWHGWYGTCDGQLCLRSVWPGYALTNDVVMGTEKPELSKYYNAGELLLAIKSDPAGFREVFKNRILIVGNFGQDMHSTPVGQMPGSVLLANIYLSLLNRQQIVHSGFFLLLFLVFSSLSYLAWFGKMPEIHIRVKWLNTIFTKFVRSYISYFGSMVALSLLTVLFFHIQVALFLPSAIFSGIEYIRYQKFSLFKTASAAPSLPVPVAATNSKPV